MTRYTLIYFKASGKYYSEGDASSDAHFWDFIPAVRDWMESRTLPGLIKGHSAYDVLIMGDDSEMVVPHLLKHKGAPFM